MFDFSQLVGALPEGRHPWQKVFDAVFLGAAMQIPSLLLRVIAIARAIPAIVSPA